MIIGDSNKHSGSFCLPPIVAKRYFIAYCIGMLLGYALYIPGRRMPGFPTGGPGDFIIYYTAGSILRDGDGARLYDLSLQSRVEQALVAPHGWIHEGGLLPYNYPPFFAALFVPFSFVPLAWAFHIWNCISILVVVFCIGSFVKGPNRVRDMLLHGVIIFSFFPVFEALWKGQSSCVVLLAMTLAYHALKREREYSAGMALAVGLFKPQLLLGVVATLSCLKRWRFLGGLCLGAAVELAVSWSLVGWKGISAYAELLGKMSHWFNQYGLVPTSMPNLRGTVYRVEELLGFRIEAQDQPAWQDATVVILSVLLLTVAVRTWKGKWQPRSFTFDLCFAQTILCDVLVSPHLYGHDLAVLVLAGFLVARYFDRTRDLPGKYKAIGIGHLGLALPHLIGLSIAWWAQLSTVALLVLTYILAKEAGTSVQDLGQNSNR